MASDPRGDESLARLRVPALALLIVAFTAVAAVADVYYQYQSGVYYLSNVQKTEHFQSVSVQTEENAADNAGNQTTPLTFQPTAFESVLVRYCTQYGVDINLVKAVMMVESNMQHTKDGTILTSPKGALGIMQVMPATGAGMGFDDLTDMDQNIHAGVKYLSLQLRRFHNDIVLATAAYNAGPESVEKYNGIPPFPETRNYVASVLNFYQHGVTATGPAVVTPASTVRPLHQFTDNKGNVVLTNIY